MSDPSTASSAQPAPERKDAGKDYGSLSRRISRWSTNGLATALVVLAGLTLGRQVLLWWGEAPAAGPPMRRGGDDAEGALRKLEFGALATTIQTQPVRGNRDMVLSALRDLCRPKERPSSPSAPASDAESKLLAQLAGQKPTETGDGWRIDQFPQGMPLVICSTHVERHSFRSKNDTASPNGANSVLRPPLDLRIVSIGLAVPAEKDQWTAYAFRVDGASSPVEDALFPLPEGSARGMTVKQPDGTLMTAFSARGEPAAWNRHFRTRPAESGWQIQGQPPPALSPWQARFTKTGAKRLRAEVHFEYDGQGAMHGLLLVAPASE